MNTLNLQSGTTTANTNCSTPAKRSVSIRGGLAYPTIDTTFHWPSTNCSMNMALAQNTVLLLVRAEVNGTTELRRLPHVVGGTETRGRTQPLIHSVQWPNT